MLIVAGGSDCPIISSRRGWGCFLVLVSSCLYYIPCSMIRSMVLSWLSVLKDLVAWGVMA